MADGKYVYPPVRRKRRKRSPIGPILIVILLLAVITVWCSVLFRSCGPDLQPEPEVTEAFTEEATGEVTEEPTEELTEAPTEEATEAPTEEATEAPTEEATEEATEAATEEPTEEPTEEATEASSLSPSEQKARGQQMADTALDQVGKPYALGGIGPNAFDTSGLLTYCYKQVTGETLSSYTSEQANTGTAVEKEDLQPGDVVFFWTSNPGSVEYQGIYIGDGKFVAARNPENPVSEMNLGSEYFTERYLFARRYW